MAQKSGFFNALLSGGVYDRKYNANDYSDNLAVIISNGVLRSENDDLKVTANGLTLSVKVGRAWIKGHYYVNDSTYVFSPSVVPPVSGSRYDRVMLRFNNNLANRNITLLYVQGVASNDPMKPAPTRTDDIYDLVLADILVAANASTVTVTDTRGDNTVCGWVYSTSGDNSFFTSLDNSFMEWFQGAKDTLSSVTLFKRYTHTQTIASATQRVSFNIPQYDADTCFVEVYVNGIYDNRHTISNNVIIFTGTLVAGTVVTVNCYKSIDGTGIMTVADEITELQNQYATLDGVSKYTYKCTGIDDNISLSQIANAIINRSYVAANVTTAANAFLTALGGNYFLSLLADNAQITIEVVGELDAQNPYSGTGTENNPYRWFNLCQASNSAMRLIFDFSKCNSINILSKNNYNSIFAGYNLNLKNITAEVTGRNVLDSHVIMIDTYDHTGVVDVEGCNFVIDTYGLAKLAKHGTFINCNAFIQSYATDALCFEAQNTGLIRVFGGRYQAYTGVDSGAESAVAYIGSSMADGVIIMHNIHSPIVSLSGYVQRFLLVGYAGSNICNGVVTRLTSTGAYNTITSQVNKNKA